MSRDESAHYSGQDLAHSRFDQQELKYAVFEDCSLIGCSFRASDLEGTTFTRCQAFSPDEDDQADFAYANLSECLFDQCDFTAASFERIRGYDLKFTNCQLQGVDLSSSDFSLPIGNHSDLVSFVMSDCNFAYGNLSNTNLAGCELRNNRMVEALLHNCVLDNTILNGSDLSNISASALSLKGADLRSATFNNLDPRQIDLSGTRIDLAQTLWLLAPLGVNVDTGD